MRKLLIRIKERISIDRQSAAFYWPDKCNTFSVIAKATLEMTTLTPGMTRALAGVQTAVEAPQAFNKALMAASTAFSKLDPVDDSNSKATGRQRLSVESERATDSDGSATTPQHHSRQTDLLQPEILPQSTPMTNSVLISIPMPLALSVLSPDASNLVPDQPMGNVLTERATGTDQNNAQKGIVQQGSTPSQTTSIWSGLANPGINASLSAPVNEGSSASVTAASNVLQNSSPDVVSNASPGGAPGSILGASPNAISDITLKAGPVSSPHAALNALPKGAVVSMLLTDSTVQALSPMAASDVSVMAKSSLGSSGTTADQLVAFAQLGGVFTRMDLAGVTNLNSSSAMKPSFTTLTSGKGGSQTAFNAVEILKQQVQSASGQTGSSSSSQDAPPIGDQSQGGNLIQDQTKAGPVLSPHAAPSALPKGAVASIFLTDSTIQALQPMAVPDASVIAKSSLSSSSITADQLASFAQLGRGSTGMGLAGVTNLNSSSAMKPSLTTLSSGKDGSQTAINAVEIPKQQVQSASGQTGSSSSSQDASPTGDQSQGGNLIQDQNAMPVLMNFTNHSVAFNARIQDSANGSVGQTAAMTAGASGFAAKATGDTAPISASVPQVLPVINTARLIQSMGQSEMRVGMRSNEFGNISISTSTTRDLISAQISVDHGELAKAIAASLPEMQARLGGNQAIDVRLDMNGTGMGQGAGTSGGMPNGSADQSRRGGQPTGNSVSSYSSSGVPERESSATAAVMTTGDGWLNSRLDIRV
jgi:hypothetical protein